MPSATDFYNEVKGSHDQLKAANTRLDNIQGKLDVLKAATDAVRGAVDQMHKTLTWGFGQVIAQGNYANEALAHNAKQNDTIICILEHISKNTCELLNEAHLQTGLQTVIKNNTSLLADLYAATHAEAALERQRLEALRKQVEECCPPEVPPPACHYEPCPRPREPLREPPRLETRPPREHEPPP